MFPPSAIYRDEIQTEDGRPQHWGRVDLDGVPFVGEPPLCREDEYAARTALVGHYKSQFFEANDPEQRKQFSAVMERCYNNLYHLQCVERFVNGSNQHYVEWVEQRMQMVAPPMPAPGS